MSKRARDLILDVLTAIAVGTMLGWFFAQAV